MFELKDKIIFITGGAMGIGAAAVRYFLEENVKHVAIIDVCEKAAMDLVEELNLKYGGKVQFIKCDVTNDEELCAAYKKVLDEHGYIDVVVNNAGVVNDNPAQYKRTIDINYKATVTSSLMARDLMRKDHSGKGGLILNISSVTALQISPLTPVYYSTKSAILQFNNCFGCTQNYEKTGVKIITLCIGTTKTAILRHSNVITYDKELHDDVFKYVGTLYLQRPDSAGKALVETCKQGENGSIWLSKDDKPVRDITWAIRKAYSIFEEALE